MVDVCDNCKRPFEKFQTDAGQDAYGFIVEDGDIDYLMSNLESKFKCFITPEIERFVGLEYWCVNCVESSSDDGKGER